MKIVFGDQERRYLQECVLKTLKEAGLAPLPLKSEWSLIKVGPVYFKGLNHYGYDPFSRTSRFEGVQMWVEDENYKKVIRRVMLKADHSLDTEDVKRKYEELKAEADQIHDRVQVKANASALSKAAHESLVQELGGEDKLPFWVTYPDRGGKFKVEAKLTREQVVALAKMLKE